MSWRVQEIKKRTGLRKYDVTDTNTHDNFYVIHTWFSEGDMFERRYYNHRWECTCGNPDCAHVAIAKQWLADERKLKKAEQQRIDAEERDVAREVNRQIDARRKGPRVTKPPMVEMPTIPAEKHHIPANPRNCEYWREEEWAQWCRCQANCPHKFELVRCGLRAGKEMFRKVIA